MLAAPNVVFSWVCGIMLIENSVFSLLSSTLFTVNDAPLMVTDPFEATYAFSLVGNENVNFLLSPSVSIFKICPTGSAIS